MIGIPGTRLRAACLVLAMIVGCTPNASRSADAGGAPASTLRVGTSGDYAPYSMRGADGELQGIDIDIARAFAADQGREIEFVTFRWPDLVADVQAGRFDVAMSGVTVRAERSLAGLFTTPVDSSGAVAIVRGDGPISLAALDAAGQRIVVNRGGHLERVARARFGAAQVIAAPSNDAVMELFLSLGLDAAISDSREAPLWLARASGLRVLGPFTSDRKAYLLAAHATPLAAALDAWLLARGADGRLAAIRARHRDPSSEPAGAEIATPLPSVLAAIDERLALMPLVAEAKRASGGPIEVPEREARVLDAAVDAVRAAAQRTQSAARPGSAPAPEAVRALFRAQIEAAKSIQRRVLAGPPAAAEAAPDLDTALRPALIRIGDRIAAGIVRLPRGLDPSDVRQATRDALRGRSLDPAHVDAIGDALVELTAAAADAARPDTGRGAGAPTVATQ